MKNLISAISLLVLTALPLSAADQAAVGSYTMTWKNGKQGTYTITAIDDKAAQVTYSYGGKAKTKTLKVKNGRIKGGGWFPTVTVGGGGITKASHSGASASSVSKN